MSKANIILEDVEAMPKRHNKSKYDSIIDQFISSEKKFAKVVPDEEHTKKPSTYLRQQLIRRIGDRNIHFVNCTEINHGVYFERREEK